MRDVEKTTPCWASVPAEIACNPACAALLTYTDKKADRALREHKRAAWKRKRMGDEDYDQMTRDLEASRRPCLLFRDPDGSYRTYAGLGGDVAKTFGVSYRDRADLYPDEGLMSWRRQPPPLRDYQSAALAELIAARHAGVEIGTGLGKSHIIAHLVHHYGLRTVVMAPSVSIASQLHTMLTDYLGSAKVGMYGDGKHQLRQVTVAISAALVKVSPGSEAWDHLGGARVFIADESHLVPADTINDVCTGLLHAVPYRFFFSATQTRNDGSELLLRGITGPMVYRMTVEDGVRAGHLAGISFRVFRVESGAPSHTDDPNELTRAHLLYNPAVNAIAGSIATRASVQLGQQTLILVDELPQIVALGPHIRVHYEFAHGGIPYMSARDRAREERGQDVRNLRDILPERFHKSDVVDLVRRFNAGEIPVLVGTSAICMGTDIQTAHNLIMIQGGKSEVKFRQAVGRGTRRVPGVKEHCTVVDFDVTNVAVLHRHALARAAVYNGILGPVAYVGGGK